MADHGQVDIALDALENPVLRPFATRWSALHPDQQSAIVKDLIIECERLLETSGDPVAVPSTGQANGAKAKKAGTARGGSTTGSRATSSSPATKKFGSKGKKGASAKHQAANRKGGSKQRKSGTLGATSEGDSAEARAGATPNDTGAQDEPEGTARARSARKGKGRARSPTSPFVGPNSDVMMDDGFDAGAVQDWCDRENANFNHAFASSSTHRPFSPPSFIKSLTALQQIYDDEQERLALQDGFVDGPPAASSADQEDADDADAAFADFLNIDHHDEDAYEGARIDGLSGDCMLIDDDVECIVLDDDDDAVDQLEDDEVEQLTDDGADHPGDYPDDYPADDAADRVADNGVEPAAADAAGAPLAGGDAGLAAFGRLAVQDAGGAAHHAAAAPLAPPALEDVEDHGLLQELSALRELVGRHQKTRPARSEYRRYRQQRHEYEHFWDDTARALQVVLLEVEETRRELRAARAGSEGPSPPAPAKSESAPPLPPDLKRRLFAPPPGVRYDRLAELDCDDDKWGAGLHEIGVQYRETRQSIKLAQTEAKLAQKAWASWDEAERLGMAEHCDILKRAAEAEVRRLGRVAEALYDTARAYAQHLTAYKEAYDEAVARDERGTAEPARLAGLRSATEFLSALSPRSNEFEPGIESHCPPWWSDRYDRVLGRVTETLEDLEMWRNRAREICKERVRPIIDLLRSIRPTEEDFHAELGERIALFGKYVAILERCVGRVPPKESPSPEAAAFPGPDVALDADADAAPHVAAETEPAVTTAPFATLGTAAGASSSSATPRPAVQRKPGDGHPHLPPTPPPTAEMDVDGEELGGSASPASAGSARRAADAEAEKRAGSTKRTGAEEGAAERTGEGTNAKLEMILNPAPPAWTAQGSPTYRANGGSSPCDPEFGSTPPPSVFRKPPPLAMDASTTLAPAPKHAATVLRLPPPTMNGDWSPTSMRSSSELPVPPPLPATSVDAGTATHAPGMATHAPGTATNAPGTGSPPPKSAPGASPSTASRTPDAAPSTASRAPADAATSTASRAPKTGGPSSPPLRISPLNRRDPRSPWAQPSGAMAKSGADRPAASAKASGTAEKGGATKGSGSAEKRGSDRPVAAATLTKGKGSNDKKKAPEEERALTEKQGKRAPGAKGGSASEERGSDEKKAPDEKRGAAEKRATMDKPGENAPAKASGKASEAKPGKKAPTKASGKIAPEEERGTEVTDGAKSAGKKRRVVQSSSEEDEPEGDEEESGGEEESEDAPSERAAASSSEEEPPRKPKPKAKARAKPKAEATRKPAKRPKPDGSDEREHVCDIVDKNGVRCKKSFTAVQTHRRHLKTAHGFVDEDMDFRCPMRSCKRVFARQSCVDTHFTRFHTKTEGETQGDE